MLDCFMTKVNTAKLFYPSNIAYLRRVSHDSDQSTEKGSLLGSCRCFRRRLRVLCCPRLQVRTGRSAPERRALVPSPPSVPPTAAPGMSRWSGAATYPSRSAARSRHTTGFIRAAVQEETCPLNSESFHVKPHTEIVITISTSSTPRG